MIRTLPFNEHVAEYEEWFDHYPYVFQSEVAAIRDLLPGGDDTRGIEVGLGTGRFSDELGIKEGIEPAPNMRQLALERGIDVISGEAEHLPYPEKTFDFVLMAFCISYFEDLPVAFKEARRVLKNGGALVIGFIDKNSPIGKSYELHKRDSVFYKQANFYNPQHVISRLHESGFERLEIVQTLFHELVETKTIERATPGFGEGSFVVIKAIK